MAEEPIKLFATRAERLPQPDDIDNARTALEKIIDQVPVLGPAGTYILDQFLIPAQQRRLDDWLRELADAFEAEQRTNAAFRVSHAFESEAFITAAIQATRIAVTTHQDEKRRYLRNALLKIAREETANADLQQVFLNAIDAFTPSHIHVLNVLWRGTQLMAVAGIVPMMSLSYNVVINQLLPELQNQDGLQQHIMLDLYNRGFSQHNQISAIGGGAPGTTNLGITFLQFVLSPEELLR